MVQSLDAADKTYHIDKEIDRERKRHKTIYTGSSHNTRVV